MAIEENLTILKVFLGTFQVGFYKRYFTKKKKKNLPQGDGAQHKMLENFTLDISMGTCRQVLIIFDL